MEFNNNKPVSAENMPLPEQSQFAAEIIEVLKKHKLHHCQMTVSFEDGSMPTMIIQGCHNCMGSSAVDVARLAKDLLAKGSLNTCEAASPEEKKRWH